MIKQKGMNKTLVGLAAPDARSLILFMALTVVSCGKDEAADKLYEEAVLLVKEAQAADDRSFIQAEELYTQALDKVQKVIAEHGSSAIAKRIERGEATLGAQTFENLKRKVLPDIREKAEAEKNPFAAALLVTRSVTLPSARMKTIEDVIGRLSKAGRFDQALDVAASLDAFHKATALAQVAGAAAETGKLDQALAIVEKIALPSVRANGIAAVAAGVAQKSPERAPDLLDQARKAVDDIKVDESKVDVLIRIASAYLVLGNAEKGAEALKKALATAEQIKAGWARDDEMVRIATGLSDAGFPEQALQVAKTITKSEKQAAAYAEVAWDHVAAGRIDAAIEVTRLPKDRLLRGKLLGGLVERAADSGKTEETRQLWEVIERSDDIGRIYVALFRDRVLAAKAVALGREWKFDDALPLVRAIIKPEVRAAAAADLSSPLAEAGRKRDAEDLLQTNLAASRRIPDPNTRTEALAKLALAYARIGHYVNAVETAALTEKPETKTQVLSESAVWIARSGRHDKAHEMFGQAIASISAIAYASGRAAALSDIGFRYAEAGLEPDDQAKAILFGIVKKR